MNTAIENHKISGYEKYKTRIDLVKSMYDNMIDKTIYDTIHDFITKFFLNTWNGGKLIMFGNGGSAADCDHIIGEFRNRFVYNRSPVNAISLADSISTITAIGNDFNFNDIFSRQLCGVFAGTDSIIALTTSGKSKNVINALDVINETVSDINSLVITGYMDKKLDEFKHHIMIPVNCSKYTVARIQEATMFLLHLMCTMFDELCELYVNRAQASISVYDREFKYIH